MRSQDQDLFTLRNKVIVVTGATGVLGGSFVEAISKQGATVVLIGQNEAVGQERAAQIIKEGGAAIFLKANVLVEAELEAAKDKAVETYGTIHGLVNGAGGNLPEGVLSPNEDVFTMNMEGMKKTMELNVWGTLLPVQVFGPAIAKSGAGSIVNISSVNAKRTVTRGLGYSMGKAAIDLYTKWFAVEMANRYGDAVRINSIMPGFFLTQQNKNLLTKEDGSLTDRGNLIIKNTPFKRFGSPEELVGALIWLLSDASKFVTGMDIGVDGGFTINTGV
ncbi:MAG: SDR family oxidoreductase [Bacteroidetes bacterium]|jgi:NAD(P)-dependent dehydrogenase (short-subunit alcohol dehydrogenase family)|nr:SDR family oxidoreductase [Bacteroidota bacterium]